MIQTVKGDILDATEHIICQQVNTLGIMGAGLALQLTYRFPNLYPEYRAICSEGIELGNVILIPSLGKIIANIAGQSTIGRKGLQTNYEALSTGLKKVKEYAQQQGLSVAIPYGIGCGLAGGDWKIVGPMIHDIFISYYATIYKLGGVNEYGISYSSSHVKEQNR